MTHQPMVYTASMHSGYGLLETLGHVNFQNLTSGEFFIDSETTCVSPLNSWFAILSQLFNHGLHKLSVLPSLVVATCYFYSTNQ